MKPPQPSNAMRVMGFKLIINFPCMGDSRSGPERKDEASAATSAAPLPYILALGAWCAACLWYPLTDTDIWWHLAAAKLMVARMAFLRTDPFCIASLGAPWTDLHWGFQLICLALWKAAGAKALVAGKVLAVLGAIYLVMRPHLRRNTATILIPLAAFGCYHIRFWVDVRPLALTLLGLAIHYSVVTAWFRG